MSLTPSVESVVSASDSSELECEQSRSARSMSGAAGSLPSDGLACRSSATSEPSPQLSFLESTSSVADSLAKTSASPAKAKGSKASDPGCGSKCSASCASADQIGCLLRIALASEFSELTGFSVVWRRSATPGGRSWWKLDIPELATVERESSLLPTPTASSYGSNQGGAAGRVGKVRYSLEQMARRGLLPTPTASRRSGLQSHGRNAVLGRMNPRFLEWMMSFPIGWTRSGPLAMQSCQPSPNGSGEPSDSSHS